MYVKSKNFSAEELQKFKDFQQRSFAILEKAASNLKGGESEQQVARQLVKDYYASGAKSFFHLPVVLFGERTALPDDWTTEKFFPKKNVLKQGDSVILDASPIYDGYLVDTSYSFCFGECEDHKTMMLHLSDYRTSILDAVNRGDGFKAIADDVVANMQGHGYEPVHTKHIGEVLGHRAAKFGHMPFKHRMKGFDFFAIMWFKWKNKLAEWRIGRRSPLWNTLRTSDHKPHDGLWLVEPHAGKGAVGAKWEEIMVIKDGKARWLDDNPPHVKQWRHIKENQPY